MRNKKMLTFALCLVLAMAAPSCSGSSFHMVRYSAAETEANNTSSTDEVQETAEKTVKAQAKDSDKSRAKDKPEDTKATEAQTQPPTEAQTQPPTEAQPQTQPPTETQPQTQPPTEAQIQPPTEAQTQPPTEAQTQPPTEAQTQPPTEAQTQPPTEAQTQPPTEAQTQPPTEAQTQPPTEAQTQPPTEAQTQPPTEAQTQPPTEAQTQPPTETQTEPPTEAQTQPPTEAQTQQSTEPPTEEQTQPSTDAPATEPGTEPATDVPATETPVTETEAPETESESEMETTSEEETGESETESESESETETEPETEEETGYSPYATNEELIAHQNIVIPPDLKREFRFTQVEKVYAIVRLRDGCAVYEEKGETSRIVGELPYCGICYILADGDQEWVYIESGNVRGFVKAENLVSGDVADRIVEVRGEHELPEARLTVARTENQAYTYTRTTVREVLAEKDYAIAQKSLEIYEQKKTSARVVGTLPENGLCYILEDNDSDWLYVESGDARGFVKAEDLLTGKKAGEKVDGQGEEQFALAEVLVEPEDNKACYYTLTSVKKASQSALTRESMVKFALQFVGNPYVWGGTSLTAGADCSGFVQSVYAYYGYSLPRVACDQAGYGMQIPIGSALPGDLIFYAKNGYVYHVSMYIGNGQVVHAAGRKLGIITSGISGSAVWATRIIQD